MSDLRADARARVLTCLELAYELVGDPDANPKDEPAVDLEAYLRALGAPAGLNACLSLEDGADQLVELEQRRRDLESRGTDALDEDDVPPGVSRARVLEAQLEHVAGEVLELVDLIAGQLPR